ncbi:TPA: glycosyl hydrolase, partial [Streptococcus suis]|nr:glycosyl hydrolase [Streptococcus suis]
GCDMFLFFNNLEEDFEFMLNGYRKGVITEERLHDALRRILGLKAKLNLHIKQAEGTLLKSADELAIIGCEEHLAWQREAADKAITLLKDTQKNLPISPETHRRIRLYYLEGEKEGIMAASTEVVDNLKAALEARGYEVTVNDGTTRIKGKTLQYREEVDLALTVANVIGYGAQNNYRIQWKTAMSNEVPWYVHEVPTIFVSLNYTTHLHDVTMVKTAINAYHHNINTIESLLDKLEGKDDFYGVPNENVWANKWQAKL